MAEESSGPGGYMPVPVILEPVDDDDEENDDGSGRSGNQDGQRNVCGDSNATASSSNNTTTTTNSTTLPQLPAQAPQTSGNGHLRRRQNPSAGTAEETTPLTLRRCIQSPQESPGADIHRSRGQPSGLLSVEEGDAIHELSSVEGDGCSAGNEGARRVSGCSTGSAISSSLSRGGGHHHHQHHVVVVATPVPSPTCGGGDCGNGAASSKTGEHRGEAGPVTPPRSEVQDSDEHDPHDNHNTNPNDSEDGEELMYPGFAPKTFYVLDQKNFFRLWCLRCITWPYPFVVCALEVVLS